MLNPSKLPAFFLCLNSMQHLLRAQFPSPVLPTGSSQCLHQGFKPLVTAPQPWSWGHDQTRSDPQIYHLRANKTWLLTHQLSSQQRHVFNDGQPHPPLGILSQLHNGGEQGLRELPDADHLVHAVQVGDDVQPYLRALGKRTGGLREHKTYGGPRSVSGAGKSSPLGIACDGQ